MRSYSAVHCTVLPAPAGSDQDAQHGAARDALYANLTQALIAKCNLLLALWDGRASPLAGGTADTVLRYLGARTLAGQDESGIEFQSAAAEAAWDRASSTGFRPCAAMLQRSRRKSQAICPASARSIWSIELAETMRTKFFLRAAGADRLVSISELINLTGIDQFAGFSWIGNLLKNLEPTARVRRLIAVRAIRHRKRVDVNCKCGDC